MPNIIEINDLTLPELDVYARLTEAQLRSRQNASQALFIAESAKVIGHALDAGCEPVSLLMEKRHLEGTAREIIHRVGQTPVYVGERELLSKLTGYELTRGILCAMRRPAPLDVRDVLKDARRVAVLEGIVDVSNMGAIFRSAAALGMDAVLLSPTCCDPLYRRCVRVSMGTVFQVPWAVLGGRKDPWPEEGMRILKEAGFAAAAMALSEDAVSIEDEALAHEDKLAIFLGTEGDGLCQETIAACDYCAMIPMAHGVDSLNVAAASAVAFWQLRAR